MKLFLSAYACEPDKGSEPGIGWNVVNELAKYHEVHVLTRANNRESIEAAAGPNNHLFFHYYDLPKWISFWKKKRRGYRLYYYLWQYGAFLHYRKFVNSSGFDIVQHLTFANFAMPSLFMFCRPKTVFGPIGAIAIPEPIFQSLPLPVRIREQFRKKTMWCLCHFDPFRVLTGYAADRIIECGMPSGESLFPKRFQSKIVQHPQTGINPEEPEYHTQRQRTPDGKIRFLVCCEFLHWKGVLYSVDVFSRLARRRDDVELHLYGGGPEESEMRRILEQNNVSEKAIFHGFVDKKTMIQALFDADILLYPSYHHGLATVILQAMYARLPILALQGDPIGMTVAQGAGIAVSGSTMKDILNRLEAEAERLANSPELRQKYGEAGRMLIETQYDWKILCKRLSHLLESLREA